MIIARFTSDALRIYNSCKIITSYSGKFYVCLKNHPTSLLSKIFWVNTSLFNFHPLFFLQSSHTQFCSDIHYILRILLKLTLALFCLNISSQMSLFLTFFNNVPISEDCKLRSKVRSSFHIPYAISKNCLGEYMDRRSYEIERYSENGGKQKLKRI